MKNILLIQPSRKRFEFFEPHGRLTRTGANPDVLLRKVADMLHPTVEDAVRSYILNELVPKIATLIPCQLDHYDPYPHAPYRGPQLKEVKPKELEGGLCVTYVTMYAQLRLLERTSEPQNSLTKLTSLPGPRLWKYAAQYISWQDSLGDFKGNYRNTVELLD